MTLAAIDLALYALTIYILFLTPGPVWLALVARADGDSRQPQGGALLHGRAVDRGGSDHYGDMIIYTSTTLSAKMT